MECSLIKGKLNKCVCLSECTLPGIVGHSERYGRFGFVFKKNTIYKIGGRPCIYVDYDCYKELRGKKSETERMKMLWGLANVFCPVGEIQDYTHEREWRIFQDLELKSTLEAVIVPEEYMECTRKLVHKFLCGTPVVSIDMLYDWGA